MRRNSLLAAVAAVAVAGPLSAQTTWQTIGAPSNSNSGAYWNNASDDNTSPNTSGIVCNAGNVLTNSVGPSTAGCLNQIPAGTLPLSTPLTQSNVFLGNAGGAAPGAFLFNCSNSGGCFINSLVRIEGAPTTVGILTSAGAQTIGSGGLVIAGGTTFSVWLTQSFSTPGVGDIYTSALQRFTTPGSVSFGAAANTSNQQWAAFTNAWGVGTAGLTTSGGVTTINLASAGQRVFIAGEDNTCGGRGFTPVQGCTPTSDRDYNDIFLSVVAVPEPSTYALMGTGLLALAGFAKRRKA
jgi:hypothetical protein